MKMQTMSAGRVWGLSVSLNVLSKSHEELGDGRGQEKKLCFTCGSCIRIKTLAQTLWTHTRSDRHGGCHK